MPRRRSPLVPPASLLLLAGLALAACSSDGVVDTDGRRLTRLEHLQLYCQTQPCECADAEAVLFAERDPIEPTWRVTGEPECPAGFVLEPASD
ncbi:hypothetical protein [Roseospira visakhapatnamensis]|uniref:Lipoprotein n=1 Tax=Roseospira visakhapatnamensis TaxID=390880 RepID=A0A7W6RCI1_9PROT|nr:hypothetical protein [Roseospira visakhapatnamensis]MBB4265976.1 hypothetical protein [Roseospira visakhapatnamensis]